MKRLIIILVFILCMNITYAMDDFYLSIRNTSVLFANQGYCSYAFLLEGGWPSEEINDIKITINAVNSHHKEVPFGEINISSIGGNHANQYKNYQIETPCSEIKYFIIKNATAKFKNKILDLVDLKLLKIDPFKPIKIIIDNKPDKK